MPLDVHQQASDAIVGLQLQRHRTGQVALHIFKLVGRHQLIAHPPHLCPDRVNSTLDVGRIDASIRHPRARLPIGAQPAGGVVRHALLFAHVRAQAAHHAEDAQHRVRQTGRVEVRRGAAHGGPAQHQVGLRLVGHADATLARNFRPGHDRQRDMRRPRAAPVAERVRDGLHRILGPDCADHSDGHPLRVEPGLVKLHQVIAGDRGHGLPVAQHVAAQRMRAEHRLAERAAGHLARVVLPLGERGHAQAAHLFDVLRRKDRVAQLVGQHIQHQRQVLSQRLGGEAGDVPIHAVAQRRADRLHQLVDLREGAPPGPAAEHPGRERRHAGHPLLLIQVAGQQIPLDDDRWCAPVLPRQHGDAVGQGRAENVGRAGERGRGAEETQGRGNAATRRRGELTGVILLQHRHPPSPCHPVPPSPCHPLRWARTTRCWRTAA